MPNDNNQNPPQPPTSTDIPPMPEVTPPPANPEESQIPGSIPPQGAEDVPFPVTDLPPLSDSPSPVENQVAANAPTMPGTPPPFDIPPVVTPLTKKPWNGGRIVGAVLGLLLLVGGVTAGVLLVRQNQDIREKASTPTSCSGSSESECENVSGCTWSIDNRSCSGKSQADCQSTTGCSYNAGNVARCEGNGTPQSCSPLVQSACVNTPGCSWSNGTTARCTGGGFCSTHTNQQGCEDSQYNCTWQPTVAGGCSGTYTPNGFCATHTNQQGCEDSQYDCRWIAAAGATCSGTYNAGGVCTGTPSTGGGTTPTTSPSPNTSQLCHYVRDEAAGTVSVAGTNCDQYTFRALVFACNGHLVNGRCEDRIIQDTPNATSVSIGSAPSCGSKQADLIVTSRPNDGLCPSGAASCTDELPGTPRVANFLVADSSSVCGGTNPSTPPTGGNGTLTASCSAGIAGTGIASGITKVHLYFDSGPEDYTANGGNGNAAAREVTVSGGSFNYSLTNQANLIISKENGGSVNLADGQPHRIRAFAINFSTNPELSGSNLTLNLANTSCVPTSTAGPQCGNVQAYDTNWAPLNGSQLAQLHAGDKVRFTISGTPANEFSKARFKINSEVAVERTTLKPGSTGVFYYEYTIPANTRDIVVKAAVYHTVRASWIPGILN